MEFVGLETSKDYSDGRTKESSRIRQGCSTERAPEVAYLDVDEIAVVVDLGEFLRKVEVRQILKKQKHRAGRKT